MTFQCTHDPGTQVLHLAGGIDLYSAPMLQTELIAHVAQCTEGRIDVSGVEACDLAGLQILCAARKSATLAGKALFLDNPSPAMIECCQRMGVPQDLLGLAVH